MMEQSILLLQNFMTYMKHYKRVSSIPVFYSGEPVFKSLPAKWAILAGTFGFLQSLQENAVTVPQVNLQVPHFKSSRIHYSIFILSYCDITGLLKE
jgi:hypothetical protein